MKRFRLLLPLAMLLLMLSTIEAQDLIDCPVDTAFVNSGVLVDPAPFVNDTLGEGITVEACINTPYSFNVLMHAPDTLVLTALGGLPVVISSIQITDVQGLPEGISYECSWADCIIPGDSIGCLTLSGTPTMANDTGEYILFISLTLNTSLLPVPITFPDTTGTLGLPDGLYTLRLNEEGSTNCELVMSNRFLEIEDLQLFPNPARDQINLSWTSGLHTGTALNIYTYTGRLVKSERVSTNAAGNLSLDVSDLPTGLYYLGLSNREGQKWLRFRRE